VVTLRSPARPDARTGQALFPLIAVTALIYMAIVFLTVRPYGGNVSAMIGAWSPLVKAHRGVVGHRVVVFRDSGYDGFTYYVVAGNPFLGQSVYRDAFRSQRIGYPVAVAIASLGRLAWRPAAMVAVNLISVLAIAYLAGLILLDVGRDARVWLALVCAVNPSLIIGVQRDLAELLMTALALGGLLLFLR